MNVKVEPYSGPETADFSRTIEHPISVKIRLQILSPRPVPLGFRSWP